MPVADELCVCGASNVCSRMVRRYVLQKVNETLRIRTEGTLLRLALLLYRSDGRLRLGLGRWKRRICRVSLGCEVLRLHRQDPRCHGVTRWLHRREFDQSSLLRQRADNGGPLDVDHSLLEDTPGREDRPWTKEILHNHRQLVDYDPDEQTVGIGNFVRRNPCHSARPNDMPELFHSPVLHPLPDILWLQLLRLQVVNRVLTDALQRNTLRPLQVERVGHGGP
ncbi:hypothetical protein DFH06DRAFT_1189976 [Mycena polygramma]|nr:hypothetical protein DFH06DRAFT_1189976 [Mycena polygramma]